MCLFLQGSQKPWSTSWTRLFGPPRSWTLAIWHVCRAWWIFTPKTRLAQCWCLWLRARWMRPWGCSIGSWSIIRDAASSTLTRPTSISHIETGDAFGAKTCLTFAAGERASISCTAAKFTPQLLLNWTTCIGPISTACALMWMLTSPRLHTTCHSAFVAWPNKASSASGWWCHQVWPAQSSQNLPKCIFDPPLTKKTQRKKKFYRFFLKSLKLAPCNKKKKFASLVGACLGGKFWVSYFCK